MLELKEISFTLIEADTLTLKKSLDHPQNWKCVKFGYLNNFRMFFGLLFASVRSLLAFPSPSCNLSSNEPILKILQNFPLNQLNAKLKFWPPDYKLSRKSSIFLNCQFICFNRDHWNIFSSPIFNPLWPFSFALECKESKYNYN